MHPILTAKRVAFRHEHPKWDQNPCFMPLSQTAASPISSYGSSPHARILSLYYSGANLEGGCRGAVPAPAPMSWSLLHIPGEQGWRSGESARLPPMWRPGFDSRTRRHMWVEFVVGSLLCSERFFSGYSGFPLSLKTNISKFQFDPGMHGHFWTSSCELLSAPWVNKLHLQCFDLVGSRQHGVDDFQLVLQLTVKF